MTCKFRSTRNTHFLRAFFLALSLVALAQIPAHAATLCVNVGGTDGCFSTIGAAINAASSSAMPPGDTINIAPGIYSENLFINKNVTINGTSASNTKIDGGQLDRVFYVATDVSVIFSNVTIQNGKTSGYGGGIYSRGAVTLNYSTLGGNSSSFGGGIISFVILTLNGSTVSGNTSTNDGGGIYSEGSLTLSNSTISGNTGSGFGGGIINFGTLMLTNSIVSGNTVNYNVNEYASVGGGIFTQESTVTLNNSTVSSNSANNGNGGGIYNGVTSALTLNGSSVSGNTATYHGGGIWSGSGPFALNYTTVNSNTASLGDGGGIFNQSPLVLSNSTVSGNSARSSGGIYNGSGPSKLVSSTVSGNRAINGDGGGISTQDAFTITNSTISGNKASGNGGGINNFSIYSRVDMFNGTITNNQADSDFNGSGKGGGVFNYVFSIFNFQNSIMAMNWETAYSSNSGIWSPAYGDCSGTIASQGFNIVNAHSSCTVNGAFTLIDPGLGTLQNNGGPTLTHALRTDSPAIDAGNPTGCTDNLGAILTSDQRGWRRPLSPPCDIGAYELGTFLYLPLVFK